MLLLVLLLAGSLALMRLVRWDTIMDSRERAADTMGSRNRPMVFQLRPLVQNFSVGIWDRSIPRNLKLMTNILAALAPAPTAAALAVSRLVAFIMEARVSSLYPLPATKLVRPRALATAEAAFSVSRIIYFSGRRIMAYRGIRMARGIRDQPQPPMGLMLLSA